jgi:DNA-binding response OmpR family regulator
VLVVDEDDSALDLARSGLEKYGAKVITASNTDEARARFTRESPDVLIVDLRTADEDGLELIREIRRLEAPHGLVTPAAALTALRRGSDRRRALNAGYQLHIVKPVDPLELAVAIERLAGRSRPT